ncbi:uncharacterized protein TM35_000191880 [Trypanosoma theileri]|uniref:Uncharacterized protein n=1 Tax=Trypanosoma theileri TaxID=67003 RepID=A0A1X0NTB0_9TRYP|nr:uncharacterized protein TM35_000191880 [Trypanosoma theileri]ORC87944.1 hypothetical protein TM35_000191880 [Trypanosoma theileri]
MTTTPSTVHSSLQRYLPGHLSKRDRRICTGETNRKNFETTHLSVLQKEVAHKLTLPSRLNRLMVSSQTVTRATLDEKRISFQSLGGDTANTSESGSTERIRKGIGTKSGEKENRLRCDAVTVDSLIASNKTGKEHGFVAEAFYFGNECVGGAGQLEYNEPRDPECHNPAVSAWKTREHFDRSVWLSRTLGLSDPAQNVHKSTNSLAPLRSPVQKTSHNEDSGKSIATNKENTITGKSSLPSNEVKTTLSDWTRNYTPPNLYDVPPPKLRFELTDYHSTFNVVQADPKTTMYVEEKDRFQSVQHVPLPTPTTIQKTERRRCMHNKT